MGIYYNNQFRNYYFGSTGSLGKMYYGGVEVNPGQAPPPSGDADAEAYIDAVLAAGGNLSEANQTAITTLFTSIKSNSLYNKLKIMYPFTGGTSGSNKFNALNPLDTNAANRLSYIGSNISFDANGINIIGSSTAANTYFNPSSSFSTNAQTVGFYFSGSSDLAAGNTFPYGGYPGIGTTVEPFQGMEFTGGNLTSVYYSRINRLSWGSVTTGMFTQGCDNTNTYIRRNGSEIATGSLVGDTGRSTVNLYIGALNLNSPNPYVSTFPMSMRFFYVADYLTPAEANTMETIINTFQTSFSRNTYA